MNEFDRDRYPWTGLSPEEIEGRQLRLTPTSRTFQRRSYGHRDVYTQYTWLVEHYAPELSRIEVASYEGMLPSSLFLKQLDDAIAVLGKIGYRDLKAREAALTARLQRVQDYILDQDQQKDKPRPLAQIELEEDLQDRRRLCLVLASYRVALREAEADVPGLEYVEGKGRPKNLVELRRYAIWYALTVHDTERRIATPTALAREVENLFGKAGRVAKWQGLSQRTMQGEIPKLIRKWLKADLIKDGGVPLVREQLSAIEWPDPPRPEYS